MVLYASYVCLLHSRFVKNQPINHEATDPSFLRWFYRTGLTGVGSPSLSPTARLGGGRLTDGGKPITKLISSGSETGAGMRVGAVRDDVRGKKRG
jgi:hypothetical protein